MYRYRNMLIGLKLDEQDESVIRYSGMISRMAQSKNAYFIHVDKHDEIPDEIKEEYPQLADSFSKKEKEQMDETIKKYFNGYSETRIISEIIHGKPVITFIDSIKDKDIDLVIYGHRKDKKSDIKISERLARKAPCSVLLLPEFPENKIEKLLVASDFSENSMNALNVAIAFAEAVKATEIICLHVYRVPGGYYKTGKSLEEFADIMKKNAIREYEEFIGQIDVKGLNIKPLFINNKDTEEAIHSVIDNNNIDLICIGSRGRSASSAILLGSLTEKLIWTSPIPVIAVKKKGEGMHFLDALLNPR
ncbi:universal stress protein [Thermodesulfobacteriota bacterium]